VNLVLFVGFFTIIMNSSQINYLMELQEKFEELKKNKEALLKLIDETEMTEGVYNSNAIENNTLSLNETERILLEMEVSRNVSLREVFEAKNLGRVTEYILQKASKQDLDKEMVLLLHKMLMSNIKEDIAGRFRLAGEYVKVGNHIAAAPEQIEGLLDKLFIDYKTDHLSFVIKKIAKFHVNFEHIHPFMDGNGRMGRVIINFQLYRNGFPGIIIRNKDKKVYYTGLKEFDQKKSFKIMEKLIGYALMESLHKRIAYLKGQNIVKLADYIREKGKSAPAVLNAAKRQDIPAFRERGIWKIGEGEEI